MGLSEREERKLKRIRSTESIVQKWKPESHIDFLLFIKYRKTAKFSYFVDIFGQIQ